MKENDERELASNRKALFLYEILDTFEAGMVLLGSEIKSLRDGGCSLQDSYVVVDEGEMWLLNVSIAPYKHMGVFGHEERRKRKLLMHANEISRIASKIKEKGYSVIPLSIYLKKGKAKVKIALVRGKKKFDQRKKMKEEEVRGEMRKAMRQED